jgi:hypothetical protein
MAGIEGAVMLDTSGNVMLDVDGHQKVKDGNPDRDCCCCGCTYGPLSAANTYCTDAAPVFYTVALEDVVACDDCTYDAYYNIWFSLVAAPDIDVTTGIKLSGAGSWNNDETAAGCVGPSAIPNIVNSGTSSGNCIIPSGPLEWLIFLTGTATTWTLKIASTQKTIFYGTLARTDTDCYKKIIITNSLLICGAQEAPGHYTTYATGGTATITPCCDSMPDFPDCAFLASDVDDTYGPEEGI